MTVCIKRMMDLIFSLAGLLILWPLFLFLAIWIKCDSKGAVLFKQKRLTKDGKIFLMLKFRTMCENAEYMCTGLFSYENDSRITRAGRFLRKTSLDELPQLFNVLKGDMSLVGPRPPVTYELGDYETLNGEYKRRFTVKAGITGLAQVRGRNELTWDQKIKYDNKYINLLQKYGILVDIHIIMLTFKEIFRGKNIYEKGDMGRLTPEELRQQEMERVFLNAHKKG